MQAFKIRTGMEVVGSTGGYVGKVDRVDGDRIRLAHEDPEPGGDYHFIPIAWVDAVDDVVHLNRPFDDAMRDWETATVTAGG